MSSLSYSINGPMLNLDFIERNPSSIASALKKLDTEGKDLAAVRAALDEIEKAHKEREESKELQEAAVQAKQQGAPRAFIAAYRSHGRLGTVQGIEYTNGSVYVKPTVSSPPIIDDRHSSMAAMKASLTSAGIAHHIEYIG